VCGSGWYAETAENAVIDGHGCQTRVQIRVKLNYQKVLLCIERRVVWNSLSWKPCYNRTSEIYSVTLCIVVKIIVCK
jgi:hypothetical protein